MNHIQSLREKLFLLREYFPVMQAPHMQNMDLIPPVVFELNPRSRTALLYPDIRYYPFGVEVLKSQK